MYFVQAVWPDSWSSLCNTRDQAKLHWLQPSGYLTEPLATQWLTQRLIGVLKASYLTHQNNKYCYQAGPSHASFLCRPRMSLIFSLLLVGLSQTAYAYLPPVIHRCAFGATLTDRPVAAEIWWGEGQEEMGLSKKKKNLLPFCSLWENCNARKKAFSSNMLSCCWTVRLTDENKALCSISLNPTLSADYILISASILFPLLLLLVKQAW